nr:hypothetical protein [Microbacterium sp. H6]
MTGLVNMSSQCQVTLFALSASMLPPVSSMETTRPRGRITSAIALTLPGVNEVNT